MTLQEMAGHEVAGAERDGAAPWARRWARRAAAAACASALLAASALAAGAARAAGSGPVPPGAVHQVVPVPILCSSSPQNGPPVHTLPAGSVVGMARSAGGYWIAASDGEVASCGGATSLGGHISGATHPPPIVGVAASPDGKGY